MLALVLKIIFNMRTQIVFLEQNMILLKTFCNIIKKYSILLNIRVCNFVVILSFCILLFSHYSINLMQFKKKTLRWL